MDHDEITCHAIGERRINYLNQIRCILEQMDDTPCTKRCPKNKPKPLLEYPGYINRKNPSFKQKFYQPMIVNVPIRELRPTSEYWKHAHENDEKLKYYSVQEHSKPEASYDRPRKNSSELIGGDIVSGCDCAKHNGLQDQCRRTECRGRPECLTNPEPSCLPGQKFRTKPSTPLAEKFAEALRQHPPRDKHYCCCNGQGVVDQRGLPQNFVGKQCSEYA